ncbi:unnamed protein product [Periconia digitata]|uniref:Uncharacterized protein n=1 Tax=Periconia digitata TaxID=1303443 RepID=A0A9W4UI52_9PLEO|nr:unnamed protein product [Periconia digitata]
MNQTNYTLCLSPPQLPPLTNPPLRFLPHCQFVDILTKHEQRLIPAALPSLLNRSKLPQISGE